MKDIGVLTGEWHRGCSLRKDIGVLPVKYCSSNKAPSLCQTNIMEIIRHTRMR